MGFLSRFKDNLVREAKAIKMDRQIRNDPAVVKSKIEMQRKLIKQEKEKLQLQKQYEQDKRELQTLKNSTGFRGKVSNGLKSIKGHLDSVKKRNEGSRYKLKQPKQVITGGPMADTGRKITGGPLADGGRSQGGPLNDKKKKSAFL